MNDVVTTRRPVAASFSTSDSSCCSFPGFPDGQDRAHQEHQGHDPVEHPVRHQVEEGHADGGGDHHVDDERSGGTQPDREGLAPRGQHQRGEHGLVRQLPDEDDREDGGDDRYVHSTFPAGPKGSPSSRPRHTTARPERRITCRRVQVP
jgi:hypothetical protein